MFENQLPPNLPTPKDAEDIFAKVDIGGASKNLRETPPPPSVEEKAGFSVNPKPFIIGGVIVVVLLIILGTIWYIFSRPPKKITPATVPVNAPARITRPAPTPPPPPPPPVREPVAPAVVTELQTPEPPPEPIDSDGDGLLDEIELELGTNPRAVDTDLDELFDKEEVQTYGTDPRNPDTDGDTYGDGQEVKNGYDPKGPGRLLQLP